MCEELASGRPRRRGSPAFHPQALRLIARGDANKPAEMQGAQAGPRAQHTVVAYRLTHENGTAGTLLLATLAAADAVIADGRAEVGTLQPSLEALGCSLEAMAAGAPVCSHSLAPTFAQQRICRCASAAIASSKSRDW